nr:hypothetical protein [Alistipes onderdonkii]
MNALFSFGTPPLVCLFAGLPSPGCFRAVFGLFPGERLRRPAWHPIKKIKNAALKTAIIQYRMLSGGFSGQRKGFAAWQ